MARICVFCSANRKIDGAYAAAARRIGTLLGSGKHTLVYGGTSNGLMGIVQRATRRNGGHIRGIVADRFKQYARPADIEVGDLHERLSVMNMNADGFMALAGGIGTYHEVMDVIASKQAGYHTKPVVLVNTRGFYQHFDGMLAHAEQEGFISTPRNSLYSILPDAEEAYNYMMSAIGSQQTVAH